MLRQAISCTACHFCEKNFQPADSWSILQVLIICAWLKLFLHKLFNLIKLKINRAEINHARAELCRIGNPNIFVQKFGNPNFLPKSLPNIGLRLKKKKICAKIVQNNLGCRFCTIFAQKIFGLPDLHDLISIVQKVHDWNQMCTKYFKKFNRAQDFSKNLKMMATCRVEHETPRLEIFLSWIFTKVKLLR